MGARSSAPSPPPALGAAEFAAEEGMEEGGSASDTWLST